MNRDVQVGLTKAVALAMTLAEFDPRDRDADSSVQPMPEAFVDITLTALTLNLCSLFEEGLAHHIATHYPNASGAMVTLGQKARFLRTQGALKNDHAVSTLVRLRNRLAHKSAARAGWGDWDRVYWTTKIELGHLGVVAKAKRRQVAHTR